jgi:hypothetical protein
MTAACSLVRAVMNSSSYVAAVIEINATAVLSAETPLDGKTLLPVAVGIEILTGVGILLLSDRLGAGLV